MPREAAVDDAREQRVDADEELFRPAEEALTRISAERTDDLDADYRYASQKRVAPPFDSILDNVPELVRDYDLSPRGSQTAAYAELRRRLLDPLTIDVGLRWDQQTYTTSDNDNQYSPRISLLYQPSDVTEFRIGWGQFYQSQEINELQIADGIAGFFPAQRAEHLVASLAHRFASDVSLQLSVYEKNFRTLRPRFENVFDPLLLMPELQIDRTRVDAANAVARGAELVLTHGDADENLLWWLSYAWSKVDDRIDGRSVRRSWDQRHTVKAGLSWIWGPWDFSAAATGHTGWPRTELITELVSNPDGSQELVASTTPRNSSRHAEFYSLDARVSRDFAVTRGELTAFFEVTNLLNRGNPCCVEYTVTSESGMPGVRGKITHWLPLVPSLGVIWRF